MSEEFIDLKPAFLAELRRRHTRAVWRHINRYVFAGAAIGSLLTFIAGMLLYHFTR